MACKSYLWPSGLHKVLWLEYFEGDERNFDLGLIRKVLSLLRIVQMIRGWIRIRLGIGKWMAFNEGG